VQHVEPRETGADNDRIDRRGRLPVDGVLVRLRYGLGFPFTARGGAPGPGWKKPDIAGALMSTPAHQGAPWLLAETMEEGRPRERVASLSLVQPGCRIPLKTG
jgi:hypothetical protein